MPLTDEQLQAANAAFKSFDEDGSMLIITYY